MSLIRSKLGLSLLLVFLIVAVAIFMFGLGVHSGDLAAEADETASVSVGKNKADKGAGQSTQTFLGGNAQKLGMEPVESFRDIMPNLSGPPEGDMLELMGVRKSGPQDIHVPNPENTVTEIPQFEPVRNRNAPEVNSVISE